MAAGDAHARGSAHAPREGQLLLCYTREAELNRATPATNSRDSQAGSRPQAALLLVHRLPESKLTGFDDAAAIKSPCSLASCPYL